MSIFCCPSCQKPLCREERRLVCPAGHSFDVARSGYVNLLLSQQTGRKHHGDDKRMVKARSVFLERGYYDPMRQELIKQGLAAARQGMTVLDAGCGEGYYTAEMAKTLREREYRPKVAGIDISKAALQEAAKRDRETEYAVASCFHLPVAGESVDLLLSVFAPYCGEEFLRVLKPDGQFIMIIRLQHPQEFLPTVRWGGIPAGAEAGRAVYHDHPIGKSSVRAEGGHLRKAVSQRGKAV